jgi:membrane fusion protein, multidrug efflux system
MTIDSHAAAKKRSRTGVFLLFVIIIAAGIGWLAYTRSHEAPSGGHGGGRGGRFALNGPLPVSVVTAAKGEIPITVNALGTVTPLALVTVRTQIAGQLTQVAFTEGQMVSQGDFLAQVDPRPYQLALNQAQGQLQRDQALLQGAEHDLSRFKKLVSQDSIARQQYDNQVTLVQQDQGLVQLDKAQVDNANLNLAYCHIVAPVSGRVGLRQVDTGNYVQTGDANGIVVITQLQPISVIFSVPEDNLPAVMKRLAAGATLSVTAFDRSQTTTLATGTLTTVDNVIDTATGTVKMRAQFDNKDSALFANQFVNVQLLIDTLKDVIVLPSSAIERGAPGTFVYTVKSDSKAAMTPVKLGASAGDNVAVLSGLNVGDTVVSDGADKLKDGADVLLPGAQEKQKQGNAGPDASKPDEGNKKDGQDATGQHHHRKQQQ